MVHRCVCSRNLVNEEALAQWGLSRQKKIVVAKINETNAKILALSNFFFCIPVFKGSVAMFGPRSCLRNVALGGMLYVH